MATELLVFLVVQILADIAFIGAAIFCVQRLKECRRMVQLMTADSPAVETDPKLIEEWAKQYGTLPKNSPKWIAYRNRLIKVGHLKAD